MAKAKKKPKKPLVQSAGPRAMQARPDAVGYTGWLGFVYEYQWERSGRAVTPAACVRTFLSRMRDLDIPAHQVRVRAYGYETQQASVIAWHETSMPIVQVPEGHEAAFKEMVARATDGASLAMDRLHYFVRWAFHAKSYIVNDEKEFRKLMREVEGKYDEVRPAFRMATAEVFYDFLRAARDPSADRSKLLGEWRLTLRREALACFDMLVPLDGIEIDDYERIVTARTRLRRGLDGQDFYALLGIERPVAAPVKTMEKGTAA